MLALTGGKHESVHKIALALIGLAALLFLASFLFEAKYQICEYNDYTHDKECTSYHFGPFALAYLAQALKPYSELVTALGTVAIAAFTWTLWRTSQDQGRLTEMALVETRRAFIFAAGLHPEWDLDPKANQYTWRFRPTWVNSGETATKNLRIYVDATLLNSELPKGFDLTLERIAPGTGGMIGPKYSTMGGAVPHFPSAQVTPQDILDMQAGTKFFYMWGWARYNDVFSGTEEHISRFCWRVVCTGDPIAFDPALNNQPNPLKFNFIQHSEGNCTDGECVAQGIG